MCSQDNHHKNELDDLLEEELGATKSSPVTSRPRIVVVDDDSQVLEALEIFLSDHYEMKLALSAEDALSVIDDETYAVLLDVKMPGRDGFLACLDIKSKHPNLPIIFHSAYQDLKDPYEIMNYYRPFGYVQKTGDAAVLLDVLSCAVDHYRRHRGNTHLVEELQEREDALIQHLKDRAAEVERLQGEAKRLASMDELTGLWNRRVFVEKLFAQCEAAGQYGRSLSVALIDIDSFHTVNEVYGYAQGDRLLQEMALVLCGDRRFCDFSARIGGEEFGVILPDTDFASASVYCEKIRAEVEKRRFQARRRDGELEDVKLTITVGACHVAPGNSLGKSIPVDAFLVRAHQVLSQAKEQGGNLCVVKEVVW
jgi:diguanylate cyclase (GGDEF)-like protein